MKKRFIFVGVFILLCLLGGCIPTTPLTDEEMDEHDEFFGVVMVLCQDMYDNRVLYVNPNNLNRMVDTTLGMHRKNLL